MALLAFVLILSGGLQVILEFGSITFITVSFLMAFANYRKRHETKTHIFPAIVAMLGLFVAGVLIFWFEYQNDPVQLVYIISIYAVLALGAFVYAKKQS